MRVLGIETSSARGSVALVEGPHCVCCLEHERANAHGESILPLIEQALAQAGWNRSQLDRIAVGSGPGSFTGLRVGIAIAQGLAEGLEVPLVGVPSLRAMALAVPPEREGCRCVLLDARKGELFVAVYAADGHERMEARLIGGVSELTAVLSGIERPLFIGNGSGALPAAMPVYRSPDTDLPHARWVAADALVATPVQSVRPLYVRDAGAVMPQLPQNPLQAARSE